MESKPKGKKKGGKIDFYEVLELPQRSEATPEQIKSAYKKLALVILIQIINVEMAP